MAPNKKKKKVISNPARGFATTSLPSKAKEARANEDAKDTHEAVAAIKDGQMQNVTDTTSALIEQSNSTKRDPCDINQMSPEQLEAHLEDAELQNLVDAHATRVKTDASRQVNRLETERRQLRPQSNRLAIATWLSDDNLNTILDIYKTRNEERLAQKVSSIRDVVDETTLLTRLWTLERVLQTLKLPNISPVIEHVLLASLSGKIEFTSDYIWGLQESLKWYAMEGQSEDLPDYEHGTILSLEETLKNTNIDHNPESDSSNVGADVEAGPTTSDMPLQENSDENSTEELTSVLSSASEDEDPSTFVENYVRLQTLLFETKQKIATSKRSTRLLSRQARIDKRIEKLTRDVLFDIDSAEDAWQPRLRDLEIEASQSGQRPYSSVVKTKKWKSAKTASVDAITDIVDEQDMGLLGDMFAIKDPEVLEQDTKETDRIKLIDFGKWSGPQPRALMEEVIRNLDAGCKIRVSTLSASSHTTRQKLELSWSSIHVIHDLAIRAIPEGICCKATHRRLTLEMRLIAAATPAQAEAYLSTAALFLVCASDANDQKQSNRLPLIWRSVYQDLVESLKRLIHTEDKLKLKELQSTIRRAVDRLEARKSGAEVHVPELAQTTAPLSQSAYADARLSKEEVIHTWMKKASASAYQDILPVRQQLPVHKYKEEILQVIQQNGLVVICADTGAGKSTQVPSFILEHELSNGRDCRILVTQPRRISAISLARRVSQELGEERNELGTERSLVGYAIRLESKTSRSTRITFATTGVLLRMIEGSPDLESIECLILDEVHERTMDLDLLFIALRKLRERRPALKIVLMSATVDAQKFSRYFGNAPIMTIPGRTFPVEVKYLEDAIEDTLDLRSGNTRVILAEEEDDVPSEGAENKDTFVADLSGYSDKTKIVLQQMDEYRIDYDLISNIATSIATKAEYSKYSTAILIFMPGIGEIRRLQNVLLTNSVFMHGWTIHLLHSSFSTEDLEKAFAVPPSGQRKIVIATNIAETGITIPDITAVIDTCKEKMMRFDERRQISKLSETFISRSSARQRRGRAARVQDGLCFHLVTKHRYEKLMPEQHVPEMLRLSLQDPILRIKVWNLGSVEETLSAAIDPPTSKNIHRAVERLKDAGALNSLENLTPLGKQLARLPLEVVLGKMAVFGVLFRCLDAITTMIAMLTSKSPFTSDRGGQNSNIRLPFSRGDSDLVTDLNAYQGWRKARDAGSVHQYCRKHHLNEQALLSIEDQKVQLLVYLVDAGVLHLKSDEKVALNRSRSSGYRRTLFSIPGRHNIFESDNMLCTVTAMAFYPRILLRDGKGWRNVYTNLHVNLAPSSVNRATEKPPKWLCYYEAMQTKTGPPKVLETSKIPEAALVMLIGDAEFKLFSGVVAIDNGRIRFTLRQWRQVVVLMAMRGCLTEAIHKAWQSPGLSLSKSDQIWIETFAALVAGQNLILK